jgi:hypothetical protein
MSVTDKLFGGSLLVSALDSWNWVCKEEGVEGKEGLFIRPLIVSCFPPSMLLGPTSHPASPCCAACFRPMMIEAQAIQASAGEQHESHGQDVAPRLKDGIPCKHDPSHRSGIEELDGAYSQTRYFFEWTKHPR